MDINYRFFRADSDAEIQQWLDLYQLCFRRTVSHEFWHWIHMENPFYTKTRPLIFIAETENRIIGSVSLIPSPLQVTLKREHNVLNACLLCKAMVHPEYRGRGIFSSLLRDAIEHSHGDGYDLIMTFSNNAYSYQGFIQEGFQYVTDIIQSKYYISAEGLSRKYIAALAGQMRRHINSSLSQIYSLSNYTAHDTFRIQYDDIPVVLDEITRIHFSGHSGEGIFGGRTPDFIRWRLSCGGICFRCLSLWDNKEMLAYLIIGFPDGGKSALIADLFAQDNDESLILILVGKATAILEKDHFDSVWTYLLDRNWKLGRIFSLRHGFIRRTSRTESNAKLRFLCYLLKDPLFDVDVSDKNLWNIQSVDTCLFWV